MKRGERGEEEVVALKTCTRCRKAKLTTLFNVDRRNRDGLSCWCRQCLKIYNTLRRGTPEYRAWRASYLAEYNARPGVAERKSAKEAERYRRKSARQADADRAVKKAYERSARGRIRRYLGKARRELARMPSEARAARLRVLIGMYEAEAKRIGMDYQPRKIRTPGGTHGDDHERQRAEA
jgi:hypothetical protein